MRIYCAHTYKMFTKSSNYYKCHICLSGWYGNEPIPLIVIGQTDPIDVNPKYMDEFEAKDLSKKKFKRCDICKDLLEKRKHRLCDFKRYLKVLKVRHDEFIATLKKVVVGFKDD